MITIRPEPRLLERVPLTGWRGWLNRYLGVPFRRGMVVIATNDRVWLTHPNNVQAVAAVCRARDLPYRVTLALTAVARVVSKEVGP